MSQIIVGYTAEGTTDIRFLSSIIERTFVDVAFECTKQIEVVTPIIYIKKEIGDEFNTQVLKCSEQAYMNGIMAFCVHVDADADNDREIFLTRINPCLEVLNGHVGDICTNLVPVIPIRMTEAWMLADRQLLKDEIGTGLSDMQLGINRDPETIADPKAVINEAIRIARESLVKRRRKDLTIGELYQPIGQKIQIETLYNLSSYMKFKNAVREAYRKLNYLQ